MPWIAPAYRSACRALVLGALALLAASALHAQSLESVLAPGKLIHAHAKWEDECKSCHVRFDRQAQDGLCMDCHKDVGQDVRARSGFHGRLAPQPCRTCHTDHKGREARIAAFDPRRFDHAATDFALRGSHATTRCEACHVPGRKFSAAPGECQACHRKDDVHKGALGAACADCHTATNWKEAKFDHATTRFALTGRHADTRCAACHRSTAYRETPRQCVGCHKKDDEGARGHRGQFGERCESCHATTAWKPSTFNHDTATKFPLRLRHRTVRCADCHVGNLFAQKPATECIGCHVKDDKHKGTLGRDCASCHTERDWKERAKFDHERTAFPLLGRHAQTTCDACHKSAVFKEAPKTCIGCHRKDDRHEATLGEDCGACHVERDWKTTQGRFDHARARFVPRNAHAPPRTQCKDCHVDLKSFRKAPQECVGCHRKDDRHEGQLGPQCASCHDDKAWKVPAFDHARTRFPLVGRHLATACKSCHTTPRFKDAARDCNACHRKDDRHKLAFGVTCDSCHNARAWSLWDFDHGRRTRYPLDGGHRTLACAACHTQPAPPGRAAAPLADGCVACHRKDDTHDTSFGTRCEQCHVTDRWKNVSGRMLRAPGAIERKGGTP